MQKRFSIASKSHKMCPERTPASIIPRARNNQDCSASVIAGAAHDRIGSANLTSVPVQRPKERDGAVVSLNFKSHRRADDEAARGKRSGLDRPRTEAGRRTERDCSGNSKATLIRAGAVLSNVACHVECSSAGSREGAVQDVSDIRYLDACDGSLVAVGTAVDGIRPGEGAVGPVEGVVADSARESNELSSNRR